MSKQISNRTITLDGVDIFYREAVTRKIHPSCCYTGFLLQPPLFQQYFRACQPPVIVIWGKHDVYYNKKEAASYKKDLPNAQVHLLNGGHMVLETNFDEVFELIAGFMLSK